MESDSLKRKAETKLTKKEEALAPIIKELEKKQWKEEADAEKEREKFLAKKELKLFDCEVVINKQAREKWPRGRRNAETKPTIVETYRLQVVKTGRKELMSQQYLHKESCIVIISNVGAGYTDEELVKIYKGQQVVENSFRMLKSPQLASVIYLKNTTRIGALSMVLTFSLLLRALIQFRLREGLKDYNNKNPGEKLYVGWGSRALEAPTFKLLYEHSYNCYFERENWGSYIFEWPNSITQYRVTELLKLMGLSIEKLLE
jgi:transposase